MCASCGYVSDRVLQGEPFRKALFRKAICYRVSEPSSVAALLADLMPYLEFANRRWLPA